jgi:serine/threonine-protein phosphatase 2A activator
MADETNITIESLGGPGTPSTSEISATESSSSLSLSEDHHHQNSQSSSSSSSSFPSGFANMQMRAPQAPVSYPDSNNGLNMGGMNMTGSSMTLAALAPVPQARPVPVVQPPCAFQAPRKRITTTSDIDHFHQSEAGKTFLGFIVGLSDSMVGKKLSDYCRESPMVLSICKVLDEMNTWIDQLPPKQQPARYGNPTYREWHTWLEERGPELMAKILPENLKAGAAEIFPYFADSFGNATRIDYGTGHEANFAAWLLCLARLGLLNEDDYQALVARVFVKYLDLMRRLQTTYWLEPAGKLTYILIYICFFTLKPSPEFLKVLDSSFNSIGGLLVASWFPMIFLLVVLHKISMRSFHLWLCMVGGSVI